ncbi:sugar phosphate isomerase/epimerase [Pseudonocardia sp. EV170527-09]|uniref:sugar phosphate isomerase/epimerase family protein n=1 Tax=Pseudonocardia sp. EV170527-09 TaxID=2603411 RepID=UPI0011F176F9|nr:sugar phosphate isomerase/epimerase family protein [Pseudonocardia sp. EV170527-09]KAA1018355.1 sugar phosphate isomerase/epimerase [Pseudonocardia sp. EV170527-09]
MIRFAYNTNGMAYHRLDDALRLLADCGYDGVAITPDVHHLDPFGASAEAEVRACAGLLDALGLASTIETGARFLLDPRRKHEPTLVCDAADGRARRIGFLHRCIDLAAELGSEAVSFWSGAPPAGANRGECWDRLCEGVSAVVDHAERREVVVAFEPEPGMLVEDCDQWAELARRVPPLRLALDTGHCLVAGSWDPAAAVRAFRADLGAVSLEDMRRGVHEHLAPGLGDMDIPSVLAALAEVRYTGLVALELSRDSHRADRLPARALADLRETASALPEVAELRPPA